MRKESKEFLFKLLDLFHWGPANRENRHHDLCSIIRIFYDALGGARFYAKQSRRIKDIVRGNKRSLILKRFPTATHLRLYLEALGWD